MAIAAPITAPGVRDRFFILTESDLQKVCVEGYTGWMNERGWKRPRSPGSYDCRYDISVIKDFEDNWELIIHRLRASTPDPSLISGE